MEPVRKRQFGSKKRRPQSETARAREEVLGQVIPDFHSSKQRRLDDEDDYPDAEELPMMEPMFPLMPAGTENVPLYDDDEDMSEASSYPGSPRLRYPPSGASTPGTVVRNSPRLAYPPSAGGSPMQQGGAFAYANLQAAEGATPVDEQIPVSAPIRVSDEAAARAGERIQDKLSVMGFNRNGGGPPVGMAQRIKYKLLRKVQGLSSAYDRVSNHPTLQERTMIVHPKGGMRMTLQENRKAQIIREMENLKADVRQDGFADFLSNTRFNTNHYNRPAIGEEAYIRWERTPPKLNHYERSGITNKYVGNTRQGYRYGK